MLQKFPFYMFKNFNLARKKNSFGEKLRTFRILNSLKFGERFKNKKDQQGSVKVGDYTVFGYDYNTMYNLYHEIFVSESYKFKALSESPVIVDCGSNVGFSVLYFKQLYPDAKVLAVEPNPGSFEILEKNISKNHLTNVKTFNLALSDKEEDLTFYIGNDSISSPVSSVIKHGRVGSEIKVHAKPLSSLLKDIKNVDLIKIDVEGSERKVLDDLCSHSALQKSEQYIVEYHHNIANTKGELSGFLQKFEDNGYGYNMTASYDPKDTIQDILIHFYKRN